MTPEQLQQAFTEAG
jgi:hypothetical protein